jgi:hypothetical protein
MEAATALQKLDSRAPLLARAFFAITTLIWTVPIVSHVLRGSRAYLGFFADDFFYYVVIANRLATTGHLTFDGSHPTNGFHPLWFVVIAALRLVFGAGNAFYVALMVVTAALAMVTFELYARLGVAIGVRRSIAFAAAAYLAYDVNFLFGDGMEVTLAVPMVAAVLLAVARMDALTPRRAALLGLLSSLAVLARLDVAILVGLILGGYLAFGRDPVVVKARYALAFGAGGLLLPAYLVLNFVSFGTFMPTSAIAKQMTTGLGLNREFVFAPLIELGPEAAIVPFVAVVLIATGKSPIASRRGRFVVVAAAAFSFTYHATCALRCPWLCFPWYAYSLFAPLYLGLAVIGETIASRVRGTRWAWVATAAVLLVLARSAKASAALGAHYALQFKTPDNLITANGFRLAELLRDRPGVYAMGDKAGNVANLLPYPIVQLEGLVADPPMLDRIRRQEPLGDVLRAYGVDYLILSIGPNVPLPKRDGCYEISQPNPHEAGERSPKMRGRLCGEPIIDYEVPRAPHWWSKYDFPIHTYVFDVRSTPFEAKRDP